MDHKPTILALDCATVTGWAYGSPGEQPTSGFVRFAKPGASRGAVFAGASTWIREFLRARPVDHLVLEAMIPGGKTPSNSDTTAILVGLPAIFEGEAFSVRIFDQRRVGQSSVKKHFVDHGRGDQKLPIRKKCVALGWLTAEEAREDQGGNRTDALAIWSWACHAYHPSLATPIDDLFVAGIERDRRAAEAASARADELRFGGPF